MVKNVTFAALACLLTVSFYSNATGADSKIADLFGGVISTGSSAASLIENATRAAFAHRNSADYGYDYDISDRENAVAACFHAADRKVRLKRRGLHARLNSVKKIKESGERLKVTMQVTNVYLNGQIIRWIKCHVKHDEVVFLKYS